MDERLATVPRPNKIRVSHQRRVRLFDGTLSTELMTKKRARETGLHVDSYGGRTVCELEFDKVTIVAEARCRDDENFIKAIGHQIAVGRAWKAAKEHFLTPEGKDL